ncbi:hypothetical protein ISCGN_010250 [Ixodes scapularis]
MADPEICGVCSEPVPLDGRNMKCADCSRPYHLGKRCSGIADGTFKGMSTAKLEKWRCLACRGGSAKSDLSTNPPSSQAEATTFLAQLETVHQKLDRLLSWKDTADSLHELHPKMDALLSMKQAVDTMRDTMTGMQESLNFVSSQYDSLLASAQTQDKIIKALRTETTTLRSLISEQAVEIQYLKAVQNESEQANRQCNMKIHGIPFASRENLGGILEGLARQLEVKDFQTSQVEAVHRLPARRDVVPPILVRFSSVPLKERWMACRGRLGSLTREESQPKLYFNDNLTDGNRKLFWMARTRKKEKGFKFVWVWAALLVSLVVLIFVSTLKATSIKTFLQAYYENFFDYVQATFLESLDSPPRDSYARTLMAAWWLALIILTNLFTGNMKAGLTVRQPHPRIDSVAQLVRTEGLKVYVIRGPPFPLLLAISQNEDFRRLYRMLKGYSLLSNDRLWSEETLREVAHGQAVIMATRTSVLYRMALHCRDFPNTEIYVVKERLMWFPLVVYYSRSTASDVGSAFSDSGVVEDDKVYQVYWAGDARTKGSFYDAKVLYMAGRSLRFQRSVTKTSDCSVFSQETDVSFCLFTPSNAQNRIAAPTTEVMIEDLVILAGHRQDPGGGSSVAGYLSVFDVDATLDSPPRDSYARTLMAAWWLALIILTNLFTGNMKAGLTVREPHPRIDSVAQLVRTEGLKVYVIRGPPFPLLLAISQNEDFRRLYRMLKGYSLLSNDRLWSEETLREVAHGQAVIMATRTSVLYRMALHCRDFPNTEIYVVKERLMWFPLVVYYSRSTASDVGSAFSDRLKWVKEAGLMNKWHEDTVSRGGDPSQCPKGTTGELDTLQFNHISSVFVLLAVGLGLAVVAFACEVAAGPLASLVGPCFTPLKRRSTRIRRFTAA